MAELSPEELIAAAWQREPGRPVVGRDYTPGGGAICECLAVGPTHVVVKWQSPVNDRRCIYTREDFARDFVAAFEQPDLFGA